jgi:hypothetical protein
MLVTDKVEQALVSMELQRLKMVAAVRRFHEQGKVPTREQRWQTKRSFGILRSRKVELEKWLEAHR